MFSQTNMTLCVFSDFFPFAASFYMTAAYVAHIFWLGKVSTKKKKTNLEFLVWVGECLPIFFHFSFPLISLRN